MNTTKQSIMEFLGYSTAKPTAMISPLEGGVFGTLYQIDDQDLCFGQAVVYLMDHYKMPSHLAWEYLQHIGKTTA